MSLKYLYQMFPDENKRRRFIINCALTFGLRAETLAAYLTRVWKQLNQSYFIISTICIIQCKHYFILV